MQVLNSCGNRDIWYAIRTFGCQELKICDFLKEKGKEHFVPMTYVEKKDHKGKIKRELVPVVHNLIFLKKDQPQTFLVQMLKECLIPLRVVCKENTSTWYEIPECQMMELRVLCDPNFKETQFITHEEAEAKAGKSVRIIHGPFTGITGKLHRVKNDFFFIKTLAGMGVMMRISRWYCAVL